jgi:hypothetical protein
MIKFNENVPVLPIFLGKEKIKGETEYINEIIESGFEGALISITPNDNNYTSRSEILLYYYSTIEERYISTYCLKYFNKLTNKVYEHYEDIHGKTITERDFNYTCFLLNKEYETVIN